MNKQQQQKRRSQRTTTKPKRWQDESLNKKYNKKCVYDRSYGYTRNNFWGKSSLNTNEGIIEDTIYYYQKECEQYKMNNEDEDETTNDIYKL